MPKFLRLLSVSQNGEWGAAMLRVIHILRRERLFVGNLTSFALLTMMVLLGSAGVTFGQTTPPPRIFFTDLDSGPNSGGETVGGFAGAYVTLYGNFLGATQGTSTVTWNGASCLRVVSWSTTWLWYQKMVVQLGPSCTAGTGNFVVTANGVASNGIPFVVRSGNIYCVNVNTGSNSANGKFGASPNNCWKDAYFAKNSLANGDIAYLRAGTWSAPDPTGPDDDVIDLSGKTGVSGNPKAMVGYPGETATIACNRGGAECMDIQAKSGPSTWWTFAGLDLGANPGQHYILDFENSSSRDGLRWVGNKIHGASAVNVVYQGPFTSSDFLGNDDYDYWSVANGASSNERGYGIYYGGYGTQQNINIQYNRFWNDQGTAGISSKGLQIYGHCPNDCAGTFDYYINVTVANNQFFANCMEGMAIAGTDGGTNPWDHSGTTYIYNNVVVGNGSCDTIKGYTYSGMQIGGAGMTAKIWNNTFYLNAGGSIGGQPAADIDLLGSSTSNYDISNNIFYAQPTGQFYTNFIYDESGGSTKTGSNNLFFSNGNSNAKAPSFVTGSITQNPLFVSASVTYGIADFHVQPASPVIGAGSKALLAATDIAGALRPSLPSLGAFELASASTVVRPNPPTNLQVAAVQ